jgi:SEC-C motif
MANNTIDPYQSCPCGSGKKYKFCCREKGQLINQEQPRALVKKAAQYPVSECHINACWQDSGLATIVIVRQLPNQKYILGTYLLDTLCLGLKNTFCNANLPYSSIQRILSEVPMEMTNIEYEDARSMIFGGIEYAGKLGFEPNRDWEDSRFIVESERPFNKKFEFGLNGKPVYIHGPNDNPAEVMAKLHAARNKQ